MCIQPYKYGSNIGIDSFDKESTNIKKIKVSTTYSEIIKHKKRWNEIRPIQRKIHGHPFSPNPLTRSRWNDAIVKIDTWWEVSEFCCANCCLWA